jgi:hypothetical protein
MDLNGLIISEEEATAKLAEYERQIAEDRTAEDRAILEAYRAAARKLPVISMKLTIAAGGFHDNGLPRIAVINADAQTCFVHWDGDALIFSVRDDMMANQGALVGRSSVRVQVAEPPSQDVRRTHSAWRMGSAPVPIVPPQHRPRPRRLARQHILWEVDEWTRVVPRDPALIKHIRGDLWSVRAVWELTDLEMAVLAQRHG